MLKSKSTYAIAKNIRISTNKVRRVLDQIRNRSYEEALMILEFMPYRSCGPIWKVLQSAASNAQNNLGLDKKNLKVEMAYANEGRKLKRIQPRAQGRAYSILKPTSHITIYVKSIF